jgi:hypothetical protein
MDAPSAEAVPTAPGPASAPRGLGWWPYAFLAFFLLLAASTAYFAFQEVPLARALDAGRSALVALPGDGAEARIVVRNVPPGGQLRAFPQPPAEPGGTWRVVIEWSAAPAERDARTGDERTVTVTLPRVDRVDVVDRRGAVAEHMPLRLRREGGTR